MVANLDTSVALVEVGIGLHELELWQGYLTNRGRRPLWSVAVLSTWLYGHAQEQSRFLATLTL